MRILLVEDNKLNQRTMLRVLEPLSPTVVIAEAGEDALQMAEGEPFDVVILDVRLPDVDVDNFIEKLLRPFVSLKAHDRVKVVVVTASHLYQGRFKQTLLKVGADRVFKKPIPFKEFREFLSKS